MDEENLVKLTTDEIIEKFPTWTMKEVCDFENKNEARFDVKYANKEHNQETDWGKSEMAFPNSTLRELANNTFDYFMDGQYEMWIKNPQLFEEDKSTISKEFIPYIMALTVDNIREGELPLYFKFVNGCFVIGIDNELNLNQCKEFYEKFYHLIDGFDWVEYDRSSIPDDEDEEIEYLEKIQKEFDLKMKSKLGDRYINGNKIS